MLGTVGFRGLCRNAVGGAALFTLGPTYKYAYMKQEDFHMVQSSAAAHKVSRVSRGVMHNRKLSLTCVERHEERFLINLQRLILFVTYSR